MGARPEGFPEFIPSTSRVSARRHLFDESPALTAVLQAQRPAIVAAGIAQERNSDARPGQPRRENASSSVPWNQEISLAPWLCIAESSESGADWCPRMAPACLNPQLPSAIAAAATAAVIKSDLMAAPLAIAVCNVSMAHRRRIRRPAAGRPGSPEGSRVKLYHLPGECSLASDIALREAGPACELVTVDRHTRKAAGGLDFSEVNPKGDVPARTPPGTRSNTPATTSRRVSATSSACGERGAFSWAGTTRRPATIARSARPGRPPAVCCYHRQSAVQ